MQIEEHEVVIRVMTMADYSEVYALWKGIRGFGIRSVDDSREGVERFLKRNPSTSMVAVKEGRIVGAILCGHDGRRGCLYHVCVAEQYRKHGIGQQMVKACLRALQGEQISKVNLIAFQKNEVGNLFWKKMGWCFREEIHYYEYTINKENVITYNP
ncbi:MAG: GNAT family N-acetyltransferase [Clostridiales bacterium]|nr:GNAT family N-acetyltransferase [Clostridiales bacterium]